MDVESIRLGRATLDKPCVHRPIEGAARRGLPGGWPETARTAGPTPGRAMPSGSRGLTNVAGRRSHHVGAAQQARLPRISGGWGRGSLWGGTRMIDITLLGQTSVYVTDRPGQAVDLCTKPRQILEMLALDLGVPVTK